MMSAVSTNRVYLAIIAVLLLVIAAMAYMFVIEGSTRPGQDGRVVVMLDPAERELMLREMRGFVAGLQTITDGLAREDMRAVASASRAMGMTAAHDVPPGMLGKLPLPFKKLAFGVHHGFDEIADDAERNGSTKRTLTQLAGVLGQCAACHQSYQVSPPAVSP
jgi:hypothetical protein